MTTIAHGAAHSDGWGILGYLLIVFWVLVIAWVIRRVAGRRDADATASTQQTEQDFDPPTPKK